MMHAVVFVILVVIVAIIIFGFGACYGHDYEKNRKAKLVKKKAKALKTLKDVEDELQK